VPEDYGKLVRKNKRNWPSQDNNFIGLERGKKVTSAYKSTNGKIHKMLTKVCFIIHVTPDQVFKPFQTYLLGDKVKDRHRCNHLREI